ncbi:MAG: ATP-dependent sacrificial sulfur transferase LarE [Cyclobacteriaceae bacterium]|nr:ATP-dependent sacrificial sulfur transferase LarE [Cyclobacteriaceae bacterium]
MDNNKLIGIEKWFNQNCGKVIIAFSGGVDSCLVAFLARKFLGKQHALAVIADSPSLKRSDLRIAMDFCQQHDIPLEIVRTKELENPNYASNPIDRCYFCKYTLYDELKLIAQKYPGTDILNGQNFDDLGDYRPGIRAAQEYKVLKPLADCAFSKQDIRDMAMYFGLSTWDKPASPCLSSRIPYGQEVTIEKLQQIEEAENMLNALGFMEVRVRHFGDRAKVEVPASELDRLKIHEKTIRARLKDIGFADSEIDEEGLVSGKLNRAIA